MAGRRRKKSGGRSYAWRYRGRIVACVFVEVIIICALVIMIGWNKGVKEWFEQFEQPVLKEVDISGINSPNAILMQARGGKILGEINGEAQIYPASMTKIMTVILGIENFDDLDEKITLTDEMFSGLYEQDATQAGFQPGEEVRVIDLLYGAMLPSGAECCIALAVRAGITIYGIYPSSEVERDIVKLEPVMELKSHVTYVKDVPAGAAISYGGTYVADRKLRVATVPVGYADGYSRQLSNKGWVLIHGQKAPILGRVCMDQFMVDVTEIGDVKKGDEVTLIGRDGDEFIGIEEIGDLCGRFSYEFACDISPRVPRVYIKNGKEI